MSAAAARYGTIVLMGVCGSGKTTVGRLLAERLALPIVEADRLHPPANIAKMAAGQALDDQDRAPWLDAVAAEAARAAAPEGVVIACSALKRGYRARLAGALGGARFVHLAGEPGLLRQRMTERRGHFMPSSLLDSQLTTLEPPEPDEPALEVEVSATPEAIVAEIVGSLGAS